LLLLVVLVVAMAVLVQAAAVVQVDLGHLLAHLVGERLLSPHLLWQLPLTTQLQLELRVVRIQMVLILYSPLLLLLAAVKVEQSALMALAVDQVVVLESFLTAAAVLELLDRVLLVVQPVLRLTTAAAVAVLELLVRTQMSVVMAVAMVVLVYHLLSQDRL
jgi:hypothetical protein